MALQEGDTVYCLIKVHAFSYVGNPSRDRNPAEVPVIH
jgi:molybdate transport system ATP-binding protein